MKRYRRGASFVMDTRQHSRQLDRNQRARIIFLAEQLERRTKPAGRRNGALGYVGMTILRALILGFLRPSDGLCSPSYTILQAKTGLCRQSIRNGLARLEASGVLKITRRLIREVIDVAGHPLRICRQGSNLYAFFEVTDLAYQSFDVSNLAYQEVKVTSLAYRGKWPSLPARDKSQIGFQIGRLVSLSTAKTC